MSITHLPLQPTLPGLASVERPRPAGPPHSAPAPPDCIRLVVAVVEAITGRRALHQIGHWLNDVTFALMTKESQNGRWRSGQIGSIRAQMPHSGAVEAAVRVLIEDRSTACAIRLDQRGKRWVCTDIKLAA